MVSQQAARLIGETPAIAVAHFTAEADPYDPDTNPGGYVNLGTAENRLAWDLLAPRLRAPRDVGSGDTRYAPLFGTERMRQRTATLLSRICGAPVAGSDLIVVSGATAALDLIATVLCDPGEAIAVPVPYYGALDTDLTARSGARIVPVIPAPGNGPVPDAAAVIDTVTGARANGAAVRALALTSPHNPLGRVYHATELADLARACHQLDLDLIADEIYAGSTFTGPPFTSTLTLPGDPIDPNRVHVIWGFAKDFGLPGLKVGVLHTRDPTVRAAARELAYFAPVSTDTQHLLAGLLDDTSWLDHFRTTHRTRLANSYTTTTRHLTAAGISYLPAHAGLSIWTDLRPWLATHTPAAEHELWHHLFHQARVSLTPGQTFHTPEPGWFRLCHAVRPGHVQEGITRLHHTLGAPRG